jgi:succinoglycan biosynthesis transport protein ExoP
MRLAFWRAGTDNALVRRVISKLAPAPHKPAAVSVSGDLDLRGPGQALSRNRGWIIAPTLLAAVLSIAAVNLVTPRYKSEARMRVHLVSAGRPGSDRALLLSPRLKLAIDALLRVYDHVLLDAGTASDLSAELLTAQARAVVVPDASMTADARARTCGQLRAVGFTEVTILSEPAQPSDAVEPGPRVVAA